MMPDLPVKAKGVPFFQLLDRQPLVALDQPDERVRRSILSRSVIQVDWVALRNIKQHGFGTLDIDLGTKGRLSAEVRKVLNNWGGGYSLSGRIADYPLGTFMASVHGDALVANIRTGNPALGDFEILMNPAGMHEFREMDLSVLPGCDGVAMAPPAKTTVHQAPPPQAKTTARQAPPPPASKAAASPPEESEVSVTASADDGSVIDLMVVYTAAARSARGGTSGMVASINQAVNEANSAFSGSNVNTLFQLVHSAEVSYMETASVETDLARLQGKTDGYMDTVHSLRDTHGADIVSLWAQSSYAGLGYVMTSLSNSFESDAFNVCDVDLATSIYTMAHECGHNMGCAHDQGSATVQGLYPSYSYGWRWLGTGGVQYRSIMAYDPGIRVARFSNPSVSYNGGITGTSTADNARTINNSKLTVSNWRTSTTPPPVVVPILTTTAASNITHDFALSGVAITNAQSTSWINLGIVYAAFQNPTTTSGMFLYSAGNSPSPVSLIDLIPSTTYYARASAIHDTAGIIYGNQISFTTLAPPPGLAWVKTTPVTSDGYGTGESGGHVISSSSAITERGVVFSTSPGPTKATGQIRFHGSGNGIFASTVYGIAGATTYVRAYAINATGTAYGNEVSFTTLEREESDVETYPATNITSTSATLSGQALDLPFGSNIVERGIVYAPWQNPARFDSEERLQAGLGTAPFTFQVNTLLPNKTYYVRAYAYHGGLEKTGTLYGNQVSFKTPAVLPVVSTAGVSGVTHNAAAGGGTVVSDGGNLVTERGLAYATTPAPTTLTGSKVVSGSGLGSFTSSLTGLLPGTTYFVRAYAVTSQGTAYGAQGIFTTNGNRVFQWTNFAGLPTVPGSTDGTGSAAGFKYPDGMTVDGGGNVYVADSQNHVIRKITPAGVVTTLAGLAGSIGSADGTGNVARFNYPSGLAIDSSGNIYVADSSNHTIRKLTPDGAVTTLAGLAGSNGGVDDIGSAARFWGPKGVAVNANDDLFIADTGNSMIRKVTQAGVVTTLAGMAGVLGRGSADGVGSAARFYMPYSLVLDGSGDLYVADTFNHTIRKMTPAGVVTTLAGLAGSSGSADGVGSSARFYAPRGLAVDVIGNLYIADTSHTIRKMTPAGAVTTCGGLAGTSGSADGLGTVARFFSPVGMAMSSDGSLLVVDSYNHRISRGVAQDPAAAMLVTTQVITMVTHNSATSGGTVAAAGAVISERGIVFALDPDPTLETGVKVASGSGTGSFTTTLTGLAPNTIYHARAYATNAVLTVYGEVFTFATNTPQVYRWTTIAGGSQGSTDGTGSAAKFGEHRSKLASNGHLYIAETYYLTIRRVTQAGVVTTLAGSPNLSGSTDGTGSAARFSSPRIAALATDGNLYVSEGWDSTIRKVSLSGVVTTFAGLTGVPGSVDGTGTAARFSSPGFIAPDSVGNLYVADNHTIRKITLAGVVTTLAGSPGVAEHVDGTGSEARFFGVGGMAVGGDTHLYVTSNGTVRRVTTAGQVTTLAGLAGILGYVDGAIGIARFRAGAIAVDAAGNIYLADGSNQVIRKISPAGYVTTIGGTAGISGSADGLGTESRFLFASSISVAPDGKLYVSDLNYRVSRGVPEAAPTLVPATISTAAVTGVSHMSAISGGNITTDGGTVVMERGVVYSTAPSPTTTNGTKVRLGNGTGSFSINLTGLTPSTAYYVRAYAINGAGTTYGSQVSFSTAVVPDDHGSSLGAAQALSLGVPQAGELEVGADEDFFRLDVTVAGTLLIEASGPTDTFGHLLDSSGVELAAADGGGAYDNFRIKELLAPGTYYLRLRHADGSSSGTYTLYNSFTALPTLSINPSDQSVLAKGGTHSFNVMASENWTWTKSGGSPWLTITEAGSQSGNQTFTYKVAANTLTSSRTETLTLTSGNSSSGIVAQEHIISQAGIILPKPLTLIRLVPSGMEAVPDKVGMLALSAKGASAPKPTGAQQQTSQIMPGTVVKVTATAKTGQLFRQWTGLPEGAQVAGNVVTFIMPAVEAPVVTAVFEANLMPWRLGYVTSATFRGLIMPFGATPAGNDTVGLLTATLTPKTGSLTGKVLLDGKTTAFTAVVYGDGSVWFKVGSAQVPALNLLGRSLTLVWSIVDRTLQATLSRPGPAAAVSTGLARLPLYSTEAPVDPTLLNGISKKQGYYTLALPSKVQEPVRDVATYPQGSGRAFVTLQPNGNLSLAGLLADGTTITSTCFLVADNAASFFIQLPTPGATTKLGSFLGSLIFDASAEDTDVTGVEMQWFRPLVIQTTNTATQLYTAGWPEGIKLDASGTLYDKTLSLQVMLGLDAADSVNGNAKLIFDQGKVSGSITVTGLNITLNKLVKIPSVYNSFTLSLTPSTGLMSGKFTPNWTQASKTLPTFQGVLMQKGASKGGHGFFMSNRLTDLDPESGQVMLVKP